MSAFTENALIKKLLDLNSSQQSIQTLSLWLIHHRKHYLAIIKTWFRELQKVPESKKLTFMYLANDVIQNSKKKGPEYGKEFGVVLHKVFKHIGESCDNKKLFSSLDRILSIWEERGVYDSQTIKDYKKGLFKEKEVEVVVEKRKSDDTTTSGSSKKPKKASVNVEIKEKNDKQDIADMNGLLETHDNVSPHVPIGDPPEPEELIRALSNLENSASSDEVIRGRIAAFPLDIAELSSLTTLKDKDTALKLSKQLTEAVQLLNEYNTKLGIELDDRKKLAIMLRDFQAEQKELLAQAEKRLEEYSQKLIKVKAVQKEIRDHLSNLPDLKQLPDVTGGLAPLPSAGDLFNVH